MHASSLTRRVFAGTLLTALLTTGVAQAQTAVRVGSKIDTEGSLLGNLIIQMLEAGGIRTENKVQLGQYQDRARRDHGGRDRHLPGIHGQRRLHVLGREGSGMEGRQGRLREGQGARLPGQQDRLAGARPANNTWAIAIRKDVATANKLKTLDDMGRWIAGAASSSWRRRPSSSSARTPCPPSRPPTASSSSRTSCSRWPAATPR